MAIVHNVAKRKLREGDIALGFGLHHLRSSAAPMLAGAAQHDYLFMDMEHGAFTVQEATQICIASLAAGIAPIVRVCAGAIDEATRLLDNGALGIVVPHVDTSEEAKSVAAALRYPPVGHRSVAGGLPHFGYEKLGLAETCAAINAATLVVVMLETPQAIANADAIAAVPGIDALLVGTNDLAMELGIPGGFGDERIVAAYQAVIDACRKHGKHAGVGGIADDALLRRYIQMGVKLVLPGSDFAFLQMAATERAATMRGFL